MPKANEVSDIEVVSDKEFGDDAATLWKRRYETSLEFVKNSDHKERCENIVKYLHNDFSFVKDSEEVFLNQFFISLKTLIPLVVANNPFVAVSADNDIVYEYDEAGKVRLGPEGQPISHDMTKIAPTIQGLLKKRLKKTIDIKSEMRFFLRNAITFNRGIFLVGHTINSEYSGSFNKPLFHAYIKNVSPRKIKRQAGTTRIDEGTYCFYEYELPVSHLKKDKSYNQDLLKQCTQEVLEDVKINDDDEATRDALAGYYDDVKFIKLHNAYDLLTGEIFVFGKGVDKPLKIISPKYSFKNPFTEFIPNETFQPDQNEPVSDLMMVENIVKKAQKIIKKAIRHIENFNTGMDVEESALTEKMRKRIENSKDRAFHVYRDQAISGGRTRPRIEVSMGPEPFNLIQFLFDYVDKTLAVYNFQQGGNAGEDETATKTQARVQTSQFKSGDMSDMFVDACNKSFDKYLEVLIQTTDVQEVVEVVGDAGEVEYRPFNGDEAKRGQYYCTIDLQSLGKENKNVTDQQLLKLYEIVKTDPDPQVQQRVNKVELFTIIAKSLGAGNNGILRKVPDTKGMDEQAYRDYLKQQMVKAKTETQQAVSGADPFPPSADDDDDIHLQDHLAKAQELKAEAANNPDPAFQQHHQSIIDRLIRHAQPHIDRKTEREALDAQMNPKPQVGGPPPPRLSLSIGAKGTPEQVAGIAGQRVPVADNPPMPGKISGQAQRTGGMQ